MCGYIFSAIILATSCLVATATFQDTCPHVESQKIPRNASLYPMLSYLIFFTSVNSQYNNLFHRDTSPLDPLKVVVDWNGSKWIYTKLPGGKNPCKMYDILVPDQDTGFFKHEIHKGEKYNRTTKEHCGTYWDRYQVLKMEQYVFIWGCVDLPNSTGHEEGLWVLKQYNSGNVLEWKREIQKIFPIGLITIEDLESPGLDFSDEEVRIECTRSQLQCKDHGDNKETLVKLIWSILFAGFIVGNVLFFKKFLEKIFY